MKALLEYFEKLSERNLFLLVSGIVAVLIALIYGQTINYGYCIDDQYYLWLLDDSGTTFWEHLKSIKQRFWAEQFRPITYSSILFESLINGEYPQIHHRFNLVYYFLLLIVIFKVTNRIFRAFDTSYVNVLSLLVTLLFLSHTSHANVVSSIKNREVIFSLMFGLLALLNWHSFLSSRKVFSYLLSLIFLTVAIFSKSDALLFIFLIPILGMLIQKFKSWKFIFATSLLYIGLSFLLYLAIERMFAEPIAFEFVADYWENPYRFENLNFFKVWAYRTNILGIYQKFMLWPFGYYFYFGFDFLKIETSWTWKVITIFMLNLVVAIYGFKKLFQKQYKAIIGLLFFYVGIAPFIYAFATGYVSVRYSFIASLGFCIILAQLILYLLQSERKWMQYIGAIFLVFLLSSYSFLSHQRSKAWKDLFTLYKTDIPKIKTSVNANRMACILYYLEAEKKNDLVEVQTLIEESHHYCNQGLAVYKAPVIMDYKARGYYLVGDVEMAQQTFEQTISLDSTNKTALSYLGFIYLNQNKFDESIKAFEQLLTLDAGNLDGNIQLTQLYVKKRQFNKAIELNKEFFESGNRYDALLNFGDIFIAQGDTSSALKNYKSALHYKQEDFVLEAIRRLEGPFQ